jgi:hypothetical protein
MNLPWNKVVAILLAAVIEILTELPRKRKGKGAA